ncbi:LysR family transcriptional regulator [Rhodovarius crocodyli]|uniref:LysR family transcriptional regulator n=1 Tax=Rhodovarius crocodyli TaxID=1979269 RepID=A0A437M1U3_9PROT|nr:LysR family transcriptional regulator [Rhodovarius crocodyli]RVT91525.1 LysR family transcriptional regulator [Rhodovarius crocodyli]
MLDIRLVHDFAVVAEELSFTRAARRLAVAQPWLSTRVRQLEAQLGVPLLLRSTRRMELTEEGEAMLASARPLLAAARAVEEQAATLRGGSARLRLGTLPYGSHIPEQLALVEEFRRRWPGTSVELDIGWTTVLLERLRQGAIDLAFVVGVAPPPGLEALMLGETTQDVMLHPDDPLALEASIAPAMLRGRRVAAFTRGLNPELHDSLFAPLIEAGARLVDVPDILDFRRMGELFGPRDAIALFGWTTEEAAQQTGRVARPMPMRDGAVRFYLVRRREVARRAPMLCWELARPAEPRETPSASRP